MKKNTIVIALLILSIYAINVLSCNSNPYDEEDQSHKYRKVDIHFSSHILKSSASNDVFVDGDYAYVVDDLTGLNIVDISSNGDGINVGSYSEGIKHAKSVFVSNEYAYISDDEKGLHIIDVSNPQKPIYAGFSSIPQNAKSVFVRGKYAYVADLFNGMRIIEVSNPSDTNIISTCDTTGKAVNVFVRGKSAYIADDKGGLQIIDISNPYDPKIIGTCADEDGIEGDVFGVYVLGDYAYVGSGGLIKGSFNIVDISDPSSPMKVSSIATNSWVVNIEVYGGFAFLACTHDGLKVFKVSDPSNPTPVTFNAPVLSKSYARGVAVSGNYLYVANNVENSDGGLLVFSLKFTD